MNQIRSTDPEKLRLLRLRDELSRAQLALANATLEVSVSDTFAIATLNAGQDVNRALAIVISSLRGLNETAGEVVK